MSGNITQRGEQSWRLKYEAGRDSATGKRRTAYKTVRGSKKDAEKELRKILTSIDDGAYVEPSKLTVAEYLKRWLADYAKPKVAGNTLERWEQIVDKHLTPALGNRPLKDLTPLDIQAYYSRELASGRLDGSGGLSRRTVHHHHRLLFQALKQAVKWRILAINPAEAVEPPKPEKPDIEVLDNEELGKLLNVARPTRSYPAILLAATTGMRRGEVLGLRWRDVDLDKHLLAVSQSLEETKDGLRMKAPKTQTSRRSISLPGITVEALRAHKIAQAQERLQLGLGRNDEGLVFTTLDGEPVRPRNLTKEFTRLVKRAGGHRITFHGLRHTHITALLKDGTNPKVVSERAGHSSVAVTLQLYGHVLPNMQADAAKAVDTALRTLIER